MIFSLKLSWVVSVYSKIMCLLLGFDVFLTAAWSQTGENSVSEARTGRQGTVYPRFSCSLTTCGKRKKRPSN